MQLSVTNTTISIRTTANAFVTPLKNPLSSMILTYTFQSTFILVQQMHRKKLTILSGTVCSGATPIPRCFHLTKSNERSLSSVELSRYCMTCVLTHVRHSSALGQVWTSVR